MKTLTVWSYEGDIGSGHDTYPRIHYRGPAHEYRRSAPDKRRRAFVPCRVPGCRSWTGSGFAEVRA